MKFIDSTCFGHHDGMLMPETCRVNKLHILSHLVGSLPYAVSTMHGHMNIKVYFYNDSNAVEDPTVQIPRNKVILKGLIVTYSSRIDSFIYRVGNLLL
jgi:hypothetical protein